MGTIKLDKDEMLKIAGELSALKEEINYILNKTHETYNVLRRENSVSTYSQERKLSDIQDLAYNLVREFDKISDNFYQAAKAYESTEDKLNNLVNINKDNNIKNIIAVNSMNNIYFNSDNTKSEEKEETTFDKLKELTQEGWQLFKDYCGLYISAIDFMKDVCDNINTSIEGYLENNKELMAEFNEKCPEKSILFTSLQRLMGMSDGALNFVREMTFGLGSDVLGMLSYEYHGLLENPGETLKQNAQSLSTLRALLFPISKEELETRNTALSGIWNEIKTSINTNLINGDPYTASRFVTDLGLNIASLFVGVGELKAASGVKKADNVIDGVRAIDKVSDVKKLSNGELWFNYFNKAYGGENVEWTSKVFEGNAGLRERVFANIEMSKVARESSNYSDFAKFEKKFSIKKVSKAEARLLDEVVDKKFLEKMKATKNKISSKIKSRVNFGYADVSIEGIEKTEFYAHSAVDDLTGFKNRYNVSEAVIERMSDISIVPDKKIFDTLEVNRKNIIGGEGAWDRIVDSEAKILHEIAEKLGENFKASGKIKLFTDYDCCPSCKYVIEQFKKRYPQTEVEVVYRKKK